MKRILLITLALLVAYSGFLFFYQPKLFFATNQNLGNIHKLEKLLYDKRDCHTLYLGSSLLSRFEDAYLPEGSCNFALGGDSALTVLEILKRIDRRPRKLVIETNILIKTNESYLSSALSEPLYTLKKYFLFLRVAQQPVSLFYSWMRARKSEVQFVDPHDSRIFDAQLKLQQAYYADSKPEKDLYEALAARANDLTAKETKVVFIDLPVDPSLDNTPYTAQRIAIEKSLGIASIRLQCPINQTADGIHMTSMAVKACLPNFLKL